MPDPFLDDFIRADRELGLGTYGIHVHRREHKDVEHRFRSDDRVNLYSVSKTFTSVALGLAESEGELNLDEPFLDYLPELKDIAAAGLERVTIRHLITMTSGSSHVWFADQRIESGDLLNDFVTAPIEHPAGSHFAYTGSGPYVVGRVLERVTGTDLRAFLMPRLFDPLNIHNPAWHTCPKGFSFAESDLFLRTSELARFAKLLLDEGCWEGRTILPVGYVHRMHRELMDTSLISFGENYSHGYGLGVWGCGRGDTYRMDGRYGQFAIVMPSRKATVTVTAHAENDGELLDALNELVVDRIV